VDRGLAAARPQGPTADEAEPRRCSSVNGVSKSFRGLRAVADVSFDVAEGDPGADRPERRRQDHALQHDRRRASAPIPARLLDGNRIDGLRPDQSAAAGIGRTFQIVRRSRSDGARRT
jgi:branched-chain amino acid transport system ATP-binding protein